ncbi:MAG: hypothetical protein II077_10735 [Treponema sp.]|nr:hypothetical protein [Treponema sp.]
MQIFKKCIELAAVLIFAAAILSCNKKDGNKNSSGSETELEADQDTSSEEGDGDEEGGELYTEDTFENISEDGNTSSSEEQSSASPIVSEEYNTAGMIPVVMVWTPESGIYEENKNGRMEWKASCAAGTVLYAFKNSSGEPEEKDAIRTYDGQKRTWIHVVFNNQENRWVQKDLVAVRATPAIISGGGDALAYDQPSIENIRDDGIYYPQDQIVARIGSETDGFYQVYGKTSAGWLQKFYIESDCVKSNTTEITCGMLLGRAENTANATVKKDIVAVAKAVGSSGSLSSSTDYRLSQLLNATSDKGDLSVSTDKITQMGNWYVAYVNTGDGSKISLRLQPTTASAVKTKLDDKTPVYYRMSVPETSTVAGQKGKWLYVTTGKPGADMPSTLENGNKLDVSPTYFSSRNFFDYTNAVEGWAFSAWIKDGVLEVPAETPTDSQE